LEIKFFDIPFIGSVPGEVTIPPVFFSYFNADKNKYETIHTDSVQIKFVQPISSSQIISHNRHDEVSNRKNIYGLCPQ